ncbi:hypothetical protein HZS_4919 [Henneguya salminicola]|nr:hypothetical protein HZS_4919 [Henneguya salminicola]
MNLMLLPSNLWFTSIVKSPRKSSFDKNKAEDLNENFLNLAALIIAPYNNNGSLNNLITGSVYSPFVLFS